MKLLSAKLSLIEQTRALAPTANASLETALQMVRESIQDTRRSVPGNVNLDFLRKSVRQAHFTNAFLPATRRHERNPDDVCNILTTLMCYGCNMAILTQRTGKVK